jgi:hypothetical protein
LINKIQIKWLVFCGSCLLVLLLNACGAAVDGEEAPTTGRPLPTAIELPLGASYPGDSTSTSGEFYFYFDATAGKTYSLEIIAARLRQPVWNSLPNIPKLRIYRPGTVADTIDLYLEHDLNTWDWGMHDLGIPLFKVPVTGRYYISISNNNNALAGSNYILRLNAISISGLIDNLDPASLLPDNTTPATATTLSASGATVYDHYASGTSDFYTVNIATPTIACFEISAYRNGRFMGNNDYFDPTLILWDNSTQSGTPLVDGRTDVGVDDYYFSDPRFCYKLTSGNYWLEVVESLPSKDGDYFLTYTAQTSFVAENETGNANDNATTPGGGTAKPISYGNTVTGIVSSGGGDIEDWYSFNATPGDLLQLQVFDVNNDNALDAADGIFVELYAPGGAKALLASAPGTDAITPTKYHITGPGNFTIRSLLYPDAPANTINGNFLLKITAQTLAPTAYTFSLDALRRASFGTTSDQTLEQNDAANNVFGVSNSEVFDQSGYAAGNMDTVSDVDTFQFKAQQNDLVTINVYAKETATNGNNRGDKVHDLSGHGSSLEPRIALYHANDFSTFFASASYNVTNVTAESITSPQPTLSLTFLAPDPDTDPVNGATYYLLIESDAVSAPQTSASYFIEVVK